MILKLSCRKDEKIWCFRFVVASTHDHELSSLLKNEFDPYHFSEVIVGNEARFDYRLRQGPRTTRTAIKLLGIAGYPESVIELATGISIRLDCSLPIS